MISVIGVLVINSVSCFLFCWCVVLMCVLIFVSVCLIEVGLVGFSIMVGFVGCFVVVIVFWKVSLCFCCELICLNGCMMNWMELKL